MNVFRSQDTHYVGNIKGISKIYQQTYIDTNCKDGQAKLYPSKDVITAADLLYDKVIPIYDEQKVRLQKILMDRGTEYKYSVIFRKKEFTTIEKLNV